MKNLQNINSPELIFLGTGGAWSIPALNCGCMICRDMKEKGEIRRRPAFLLKAETNLLIDCGPDIAMQLNELNISKPAGILISHEHGDHYMGLDELYSYKQTVPEDTYEPIPVFMTPKSWEVIETRFNYLADRNVIRIVQVEPFSQYQMDNFEIIPFKTDHGAFARGSVGYFIRITVSDNREVSVLYTSDFYDIPELPDNIISPDYLIIQSFWLNEPVINFPKHMSFQRAVEFIELINPRKETFLVHIGDGDPVSKDPANIMPKKLNPQAPLCSPENGKPYPVPLNQEQWQKTVDQILSDRAFPHKVTVSFDGLKVIL